MCPIVPYFDDNINSSVSKNWLYHFTTAESFIKILETMTLKVSKFENLNDPSDGMMDWTGYELSDFVDQVECEDFVMQNCSLISFSRDFKRNGQIQRATCHHRMWAQYADNFNGVCIVIDKDSFIRENSDLLNTPGCKYAIETVRYSDFVKEIKYDNTDYTNFLFKHRKPIFFTKNADWKEEGEVRFLGINLTSNFLSIQNSIAYICLGTRFFDARNDGKDYRRILAETLTDSANKCYHRIIPDSFATMVCSFGHYLETFGYQEIQRAFQSESIVFKRINEYQDWCRDKRNYMIRRAMVGKY